MHEGAQQVFLLATKGVCARECYVCACTGTLELKIRISVKKKKYVYPCLLHVSGPNNRLTAENEARELQANGTRARVS